MTALMMLCGGDGVADMIGRHFKSPKLKHSPQKSVAGSLGVFFGGLLLSLIILAIYSGLGYFPGSFSRFLLPLTFIALASTLVESLPHKDIDNITVTLVSAILGIMLLK